MALVLATLCLGTLVLEVRSYYLLSLLVLLEIMLPFALLFEGRRPQARELVVVAVLCALGVAGRAAFFMLPQCKPVMALVILSGAALGAQTGFLVGALTMLLSNFLFGQGPWTPWQMVAMGLVGFLAGGAVSLGAAAAHQGGLVRIWRAGGNLPLRGPDERAVGAAVDAGPQCGDSYLLLACRPAHGRRSGGGHGGVFVVLFRAGAGKAGTNEAQIRAAGIINAGRGACAP